MSESNEIQAPKPYDAAGWGDLVTRRQVERLDETPRATQTHQPVPHHVCIDYVQDCLTRREFVLSDPTIYLDSSRHNLYAGWGIRHKSLPPAKGFGWECFLLNSNNKKRSMMVGAGNTTFICGNGMQIAPLGMYRAKHTKNVGAVDKSGLPRWQGRLLRMVNRIDVECRRIHHVVTSCKQVTLDPDSKTHRAHVRSVVLQSAHEKKMNAAGALSVYNHWLTPEHAEFKKDKSVWRLMQAYTSQARGKTQFESHDNMIHMFDTFADEFGTVKMSTLKDPVAIPGGDF